MRRWVLLLFLAACTPLEQPFVDGVAGEPRLDKQFFYTADQAKLPYRAWLPKKKPRAVIVALHGMNDYSYAFNIPGQYFTAKDIAVYAYDQRGFGSAPDVGIWGNEKNLMSDLSQFTALIARKHPGVPLYLLGESMGGAVAIKALAEYPMPHVKGLILVAPAMWGGDTMNSFYRSTVWLTAHVAPFHEFTGSDLKILASNNIPMLRQMVADPLVLKKTRADAIYGLVNLMDSAYGNAPHIVIPALLLYGGNDQVIPLPAIESALLQFRPSLTYVYYPNGYHMLLRDLQGQVVMDDILSWIKNPSTPLPSGFGKPALEN